MNLYQYNKYGNITIIGNFNFAFLVIQDGTQDDRGHAKHDHLYLTVNLIS